MMLVRLNQQLPARDPLSGRAWSPGFRRPDQTLEEACGSCRDTGWLLVQILRHLGLAARFASGYLIQLVADVKSLDGPARAGARLHRPACLGRSVFARRGLGRVRSDLGPARRRGSHSAGVHRRPGQRGAGHRCDRCLQHAIRRRDERDAACTRIHGSPSPTAMRNGRRSTRLGEQVDADLAAQDVRLTQGGEPTFVSIDDMEGAEWNTARVRQKKRELAEALLHRLRARFAPGGFVHIGQGKWYPGEPLPRWALGCIGAPTAKPLWSDDTLIADTRARRQVRSGGGAGLHRRAGGRARIAVRARAHRVRGCTEAAQGRGRAALERRSACRPDLTDPEQRSRLAPPVARRTGPPGRVRAAAESSSRRARATAK